MIKNLTLIFIGGGLGSICRYLIGKYFSQFKWVDFNLGTLIVNVIGSFLIGLFIGYFLKDESQNQSLYLLTAIGFCGGFTTFSSFSVDQLNLLKSGAYQSFFIYLMLSLVLGLTATFLGLLLTKA